MEGVEQMAKSRVPIWTDSSMAISEPRTPPLWTVASMRPPEYSLSSSANFTRPMSQGWSAARTLPICQL